jgi:RNA polymerase sigma-70 factor (ECF subfamily)
MPTRESDSIDMSIETLVGKFHAPLYRYAFRLTKKQSDAEDLVQQTFLVAIEKLDQLRDSTKISSWLFAVTRNLFLKSCRKSRPTPVAVLELDVDQIPAAEERDEIDSESIQLALNQLSDEYRVILALFYFEDASYKDIAEALDIPIGTVMSRLSRAKGQLRRLLLDRDADSNSELADPVDNVSDENLTVAQTKSSNSESRSNASGSTPHSDRPRNQKYRPTP